MQNKITHGKNNISGDIKTEDDFVSDTISSKIRNKTKNPIDDLQFVEEKESKSFKWYYLLIVLLIGLSIGLNSLLQRKQNNSQERNTKSSTLNSGLFNIKDYFIDQMKKPYVVTIGEFKDFGVAKQEAIKLLPKLKQIDIKQLKSGIFTFEIERFSSKDKAYVLSKDFMNDGFSAVHVRYLLDQ